MKSRRMGSGRKLIGLKGLKGLNDGSPKFPNGKAPGCDCTCRRHWHLQQRSSGLRKRQLLTQRRTPGHRKASPPHRHLRQPRVVIAVRQPGGQPKGCRWAHQGGVPGRDSGSLTKVRRGGGRGLMLGGRGRLTDGGLLPPNDDGVNPRCPKGSGVRPGGRLFRPVLGSSDGCFTAGVGEVGVVVLSAISVQLQRKQSLFGSISIQPLKHSGTAGHVPGPVQTHRSHPSSPRSTVHPS